MESMESMESKEKNFLCSEIIPMRLRAHIHTHILRIAQKKTKSETKIHIAHVRSFGV